MPVAGPGVLQQHPLAADLPAPRLVPGRAPRRVRRPSPARCAPPSLPQRHASSRAAVAAGPDAKSFMCCALFSGVVGFVLNLASFWCNQVRGPLPALSPPLRLTDALAASVELGDDVRGGWGAEQDPAAAPRGAALLQRHHRPAVVRASNFRLVLPCLWKSAQALLSCVCVCAGCTSRCRCAAASSTRT